MVTEYYLLPFPDVEAAAAALADDLKVGFEARDSDYLGGDYCCWGPGRALIIRCNDDFGDGPYVSGANETAIVLVVQLDRDQAPAVWDRLRDLLKRRPEFVPAQLVRLSDR